MLALSEPNWSTAQALEACVSRIQNLNLKQRLESIEPHLTVSEAEFRLFAANKTLNSLIPHTNIAGFVSSDEMVATYDQRMARSTSAGRAIYDQIMLRAPDGRCPLCAHRVVSSLDHTVGKAEFPSLALTPINLVPACIDCNKIKGAFHPSSSTNHLFNPYFDDVSQFRWLFVEVLETAPAGFRFYADCDAIPGPLKPIVSWHFEKLNLAQLYSAQAANQLSVCRQFIEMTLAADGSEAVASEMSRLANSAAAHDINCWQRAFYEACASSDWFTLGGFLAR